MQVVDATFSKRVLLTAAGFSRNWGGLLASEVTGKILAHPAIQARPSLAQLVLREPSFEDALEQTRARPAAAGDVEAMETAIKAAFDGMDAGYRVPNPPVLTATINDFISKFCPGQVGVGTGYVFSLNQDLLPERIYGTVVNRQKLELPGITWVSPPPLFPAGGNPIPLAALADPAVTEPELLRRFNYIKLHGSINWRSSDGASLMVMGRRKPLTIARWPLIDWYHRVFEQVLFSGGVRLMVVGYGWGDEHINDPIAEAVRNHGLKIYSWDHRQPREMLADARRGSDILPGIMGFTTRSMTEVMPNNPTNPGSAYYDGIVGDFF